MVECGLEHEEVTQLREEFQCGCDVAELFTTEEDTEREGGWVAGREVFDGKGKLCLGEFEAKGYKWGREG